MTTFTLEALRELLRHMEWADSAVWRAALSHLPATTDARLGDLLAHLHGVQRGFLNVWTSRPMATPPAEAPAGLGTIRALSHPYYAEVGAWFETLDDAALTRPISMPWLAEYEQRMGRTFDKPTLAETVVQVASHSTYHRGQVNARLREVGGEPPLVDYIAWIWFGKPTPDWATAV
jgi:uncharacterized damage-inducible protein DinB